MTYRVALSPPHTLSEILRVLWRVDSQVEQGCRRRGTHPHLPLLGSLARELIA